MDVDTVRSWLGKHKLRAVGVYFFLFNVSTAFRRFLYQP
jgi:hypothetical protein